MLHSSRSKTSSLRYIAASNDPHFQNERILVHENDYTSNMQCKGSPDKDCSQDINQPYHNTI